MILSHHASLDRQGREEHTNALAAGGLVDPYDPANVGDPLRYLAYTTAQLGNAFPWAETAGTQGGGDGNRTAGGNLPHYDAKMQGLFSQLSYRPLVKWHVNKDEIFDYKWWDYGCDLVDFLGISEYHEDCWDRDGHVDYDNTDDDGTDIDGDLFRIGRYNYPYAIRAAAGLIYYFAVQTNQIAARTIFVTNSANSGPGSLCQAIADAPTGYSIKFMQDLDGQTIALTTGQLLINKDLTIDASALTGGLTVTSNYLSRVFEIGSGRTVSIKGLTIADGSADFGGGIRNNGTLTLTDSTVSGSLATSQGGGIYNYFGNLTLRGVALSGNSANSQGGAIWAAGATTDVRNSTIVGNLAGHHAGIANENGSLKVVHSSIAGNQAVAAGSAGGGREPPAFRSGDDSYREQHRRIEQCHLRPGRLQERRRLHAHGSQSHRQERHRQRRVPRRPTGRHGSQPVEPAAGLVREQRRLDENHTAADRLARHRRGDRHRRQPRHGPARSAPVRWSRQRPQVGRNAGMRERRPPGRRKLRRRQLRQRRLLLSLLQLRRIGEHVRPRPERLHARHVQRGRFLPGRLASGL